MFATIPNPIPARMKGVNRAEVCDVNFSEFVKSWDGIPDAKPAPDEAILEGSALDARGFRDLFESQLISRHLDLMARVLRVQNKVFYTIGSSGHEGNAMVARCRASHRPRVPALPQWRFHGRALPQAARHGSDHGLGAELRGERGRPGIGWPPQGLGQQAAVGAAADFDDRLAPAEGTGHRGRDRSRTPHRPPAADSR
jgi:hypothetical protein